MKRTVDAVASPLNKRRHYLTKRFVAQDIGLEEPHDGVRLLHFRTGLGATHGAQYYFSRGQSPKCCPDFHSCYPSSWRLSPTRAVASMTYRMNEEEAS